ncbi:MAG: hypothetical protein AAF975_09500, partial [Spirochaetota bacterium]
AYMKNIFADLSSILRFSPPRTFAKIPACLFWGCCFIVLYSCQSVSGANRAKPSKGTAKLPLVYEEKTVKTLIIPFNKDWKIYPEGTEVGSPYEASVSEQRAQLAKGSHLLYFGATKKDVYYSKTQYMINNRPDVSLEAYIKYLMSTAYSHVEDPRNLGMIETEGGIKGQLLQYLVGGMLHVEFIYRVENFFLRTIIYTEVSICENQEELNKNDILTTLRGIRTELAEDKQGKKTKQADEAKPPTNPGQPEENPQGA